MRDVAQPAAPQWADTHAATPDEYTALVATFDLRSSLGLRNAIALSLQFRSGLRVGELAPIDLAHLDIDRPLRAAAVHQDPPAPPPPAAPRHPRPAAPLPVTHAAAATSPARCSSTSAPAAPRPG